MYNNSHHSFLTQYNHKLFAHCNRWGNDVIDYIRDLRPKVIKFLDPNFDNVKLVRELVPDALLIYRQWQPSQPLGHSELEAFDIGFALGQELGSVEAVKKGLVNLVEGYNEVIGETASEDDHLQYASFQLGFQKGLKISPHAQPVAFNFGTGNMTADLILAYYGEVLDSYKWLGFHEYDWPAMDRLHNHGIAEGNGGMWLALRYRRIMEPIIEAMGNKHSVIITECGMTQGVLGGDDVGFAHPKNTINGEWSGYPVPIPADYYWQSLQWYNSELMKDSYVAGACLFVTGGISPWESFETIGTITPFIKDYQEEIMADDKALRVLTPEEMAKIPSYRPPFLSQAAGDGEVFVDDLRPPDDGSLGVLPRFTTYEQLQDVFKLDINLTYGYEAAKPGELYWRVIGFYFRTGVAAFIPKVLDVNGQPPDPGVLVWASWPGAPSQNNIDPPYHNRGVAGFTNVNGDIGFGFGGGAVLGPDGGVYDIWINVDPPQGSRFFSNAAINFSWHGATDHGAPHPIFMAVVKEGSTPPPSGDNARLVIYQGGVIRYVTLIGGTSTKERIALEVGGQEVAYVETDETG